jgi:hypothetical protein
MASRPFTRVGRCCRRGRGQERRRTIQSDDSRDFGVVSVTAAVQRHFYRFGKAAVRAT